MAVSGLDAALNSHGSIGKDRVAIFPLPVPAPCDDDERLLLFDIVISSVSLSLTIRDKHCWGYPSMMWW